MQTDPKTGLPTMCLGMARDSIDKWGGSCEPGINGDSKVYVTVLPSKDQTGCRPLGEFKLPMQETCEKLLAPIVDQCERDAFVR